MTWLSLNHWTSHIFRSHISVSLLYLYLHCISIMFSFSFLTEKHDEEKFERHNLLSPVWSENKIYDILYHRHLHNLQNVYKAHATLTVAVASEPMCITLSLLRFISCLKSFISLVTHILAGSILGRCTEVRAETFVYQYCLLHDAVKTLILISLQTLIDKLFRFGW